MDLVKLLESLKNKLEEEKEQLLKLDNPNDLIKVIEEKKEILVKLSKFNKEDFSKYEDIIIEIDKLSKENLSLAMNNMSLIDELFSAIFEESVEKYNPYGEVSKKGSSGIFNKKI
ncbi:hypothetical protein [Hydrogenothermus marinus]|uniref:FlgN protein n=1 Tax=Hydrogenothermus marinus TaxID=133270 RepID=A0A3M0BJX2_9AQUI|nr:hypothetical protein [Hydrogenothermus marinus]RMA97511.1 hypothetical protein CLV39_0124 [Hydrogenothermus marinus]